MAACRCASVSRLICACVMISEAATRPPLYLSTLHPPPPALHCAGGLYTGYTGARCSSAASSSLNSLCTRTPNHSQEWSTLSLSKNSRSPARGSGECRQPGGALYSSQRDVAIWLLWRCKRRGVSAAATESSGPRLHILGHRHRIRLWAQRGTSWAILPREPRCA